MKFGKSLSNQIDDTLLELIDKFLSYEELKERLKLIRSCDYWQARFSDEDTGVEEIMGGYIKN
ncbi:putative SPX domain-containing protein [Helianthus anomalus]